MDRLGYNNKRLPLSSPKGAKEVLRYRLTSTEELSVEAFINMVFPIVCSFDCKELEAQFVLAEFEEQRKQGFPNPASRLIYLN